MGGSFWSMVPEDQPLPRFPPSGWHTWRGRWSQCPGMDRHRMGSRSGIWAFSIGGGKERLRRPALGSVSGPGLLIPPGLPSQLLTDPETITQILAHMGEPTSPPTTKRVAWRESHKLRSGNAFQKWAWIDSNYRPHASQAFGATAGSRHVVGIQGAWRVDRGCPAVGMTGFRGACRHPTDTTNHLGWRNGPCPHPNVRVRFGPVNSCPSPRQVSTMTIRRNDPCPCGSGKKFKQCHGKPSANTPSPEEAAWRRLRRALDGFPSTMLRFVERVYGPDVLDEAWDEYHLWVRGIPDPNPRSSENQVFMPWFFHRWSPDPMDTLVADPQLHGREPTDVFLEQRGKRLDPTLSEYLEACLDAPFTFHEILEVEPGRGFKAREVFTGEERSVLERSASQTMACRPASDPRS